MANRKNSTFAFTKNKRRDITKIAFALSLLDQSAKRRIVEKAMNFDWFCSHKLFWLACLMEIAINLSTPKALAFPSEQPKKESEKNDKTDLLKCPPDTFRNRFGTLTNGCF